MCPKTIIETMLQSEDTWNRVAHYTGFGIFNEKKNEMDRRNTRVAGAP